MNANLAKANKGNNQQQDHSPYQNHGSTTNNNQLSDKMREAVLQQSQKLLSTHIQHQTNNGSDVKEWQIQAKNDSNTINLVLNKQSLSESKSDKQFTFQEGFGGLKRQHTLIDEQSEIDMENIKSNTGHQKQNFSQNSQLTSNRNENNSSKSGGGFNERLQNSLAIGMLGKLQNSILNQQQQQRYENNETTNRSQSIKFDTTTAVTSHDQLNDKLQSMKDRYNFDLQFQLQISKEQIQKETREKEKRIVAVYLKEIAHLRLQNEEVRLQMTIKEKTIKKLIRLLHRQESEIDRQFGDMQKKKKLQEAQEKFKVSLFYQPSPASGQTDAEKKMLLDYLRKIDEENETLKNRVQIINEHLESMRQVSEECIQNAEKYRDQNERTNIKIRQVKEEMAASKAYEEELRLMQELEHQKNIKKVEDSMIKLRSHYEKELRVKDATIKSLELRLQQHKIQIRQAIGIMKVPRLMDKAEKMLNYDKLEITKYSPSRQSLRGQKLKNGTLLINQSSNQLGLNQTYDNIESSLDLSSQFNQLNFTQKQKHQKSRNNNRISAAFTNTQIQQQLNSFFTDTTSIQHQNPYLVQNSLSQDFNFKTQNAPIISNQRYSNANLLNNSSETVLNQNQLASNSTVYNNPQNYSNSRPRTSTGNFAHSRNYKSLISNNRQGGLIQSNHNLQENLQQFQNNGDSSNPLNIQGSSSNQQAQINNLQQNQSILLKNKQYLSRSQSRYKMNKSLNNFQSKKKLTSDYINIEQPDQQQSKDQVILSSYDSKETQLNHVKIRPQSSSNIINRHKLKYQEKRSIKKTIQSVNKFINIEQQLDIKQV